MQTCLHLNRAACSQRSHEGCQFNPLTSPAERVRSVSRDEATEVHLTLCVAVLFAGWASRRLRTGCRPTRSLPGLVTAHSPTRNTAAPCRAAGAPLHPDLHPQRTHVLTSPAFIVCCSFLIINVLFYNEFSFQGVIFFSHICLRTLSVRNHS